MSNPGGDNADLIVRVRSALLDAAEALVEHRDSLVLVGAQAVYLRTGGLQVALAEATKDSDVALDPRTVADEPLLDEAMRQAGFHRSDQPGSWLNREGIPVDLMVPEALAGGGGRDARGARIPPHSKHTARRARGLEACLVDNDEMEVPALDPQDERSARLRAARTACTTRTRTMLTGSFERSRRTPWLRRYPDCGPTMIAARSPRRRSPPSTNC